MSILSVVLVKNELEKILNFTITHTYINASHFKCTLHILFLVFIKSFFINLFILFFCNLVIEYDSFKKK